MSSGNMNVTVSNDGLRFSSTYALSYYCNDDTDFWAWLGPLLGFFVVFTTVVLIIACRYRRKKREERARNLQIVSPLENQIEMQNVEFETSSSSPPQQQQSQLYYPIQQINQMPMFGYPQQYSQQPSVVFVPLNPQMLQNQTIPQPYGSNPQINFIPQPHGSNNFIPQPYGSNPQFMNVVPQPFPQNQNIPQVNPQQQNVQVVQNPSNTFVPAQQTQEDK